MNSSYSEEMNILINDFNRELENILNGRNINELGIIDLRRLKHEYETVHELNLDLQERARQSTDVDTEELRNLLTTGDELYESNRVSLVNIQEVLNAKTAIGRSKLRERREVTESKRRNLDAISKLRASLDQLRGQFNNNTSAEIRAVYEGIITNFENNIRELEELDKSYDDRLAAIENDLAAIRFGGPLSELENLQEATTGLTQEQAQAEVERMRSEQQQEEQRQQEQEQQEQQRRLEEQQQREQEEERRRIEEEQRRANGIAHASGINNNQAPEEDHSVDLSNPIDPNTDDLNQGLEEDETIDLNAPILGGPAQQQTQTAQAQQQAQQQTQTAQAQQQNQAVPAQQQIQQQNQAVPAQQQNQQQNQAVPAQQQIQQQTQRQTPPQNAGTLEDLINRGVLPKNLNADRIVEVCQAVGLNATDLTFKPNAEQLARLKGDMVIQKAIFNENMVKKHQARIDQYDRLIAHYDELLANRLQGDTFSAEYIAKITSVRERLENERAQYQAKVARINGESLEEHFEFTNSPSGVIAGHKVETLDRREERTNDKIREQYAILDEQRREKAALASRKMKSRMDKKIEKTLSRIEKLQAKKSKVSANQTHIINEHSSKYIARMTDKLTKHSARQRVVDENVREITAIRDRIDALNAETTNLQQDAATLTTSFRDRMTRASLNRESRVISREIERLRVKQGRCDRRIQHIQHINVNRTR